jgi:hypothetical protein
LAFLFSNGSYIHISGPPGSIDVYAFGINNAGDISGWYAEPGHGNHILGYVYSGGNYTTLDVPGSIFTEAMGINNRDQVVGLYGSGINAGGFITTEGFLYSGGTYTMVSFPGNTDTQAWGINDRGQIVGYISIPFPSQAPPSALDCPA